MEKINTLTVNPSVDKSTTVDGIKPIGKLRCSETAFEAGGWEINVSRVIDGIGETSQCQFMAGWATNFHLTALVKKSGMRRKVIPIQGWPRENLAVTDTTNNRQYRFGMPRRLAAL